MKVWDCKQNKEIYAPYKVERFIEQIIKLCKEYDLSLAHEDRHGSFVIEEYKEENIDWLMGACLDIQKTEKSEEVSEEEKAKRAYLNGLFEAIKAKGFDTFEARGIIEKTDIIDSIWWDTYSTIRIPFEEQAERVIACSQQKTPKRYLTYDQQLAKITHLMEGRIKMMNSLSDEDVQLMAEETIKATGIDEIMKANEKYYGKDGK